MTEKTLHTLEFHKVLEILVSYASSEPGRELCASLRPFTDYGQIETQQTETADALAMILRRNIPGFNGNKPLGDTIKTLAIGGDLSSSQLLKIADLL